MLNHPQEDRTTMKTYVRGTQTQAQGRPRKAGYVSKSVGQSARHSKENAPELGAGRVHAGVFRPHGAELQTGRPAGWKVIYERVPRLPGGTQVREKAGKLLIQLDAGTWDKLWSMSRRMKAAHPLDALLKGFVTAA